MTKNVDTYVLIGCLKYVTSDKIFDKKYHTILIYSQRYTSISHGIIIT